MSAETKPEDKAPAGVQAWAIKGPDGKLFLHTVRGTELAAWEPFELLCPKATWTDDGYRCVPVQITERGREG